MFIYLGYFDPYILNFISFVLVFFSYPWLFPPLICFTLLSYVVNFSIKNIIRQPRPSNEIRLFNSDHMKIDTYGMPSGHAQIVSFFTVILIYLYKNTYLSLFSLIVSLATYYQRWLYRAHTLGQVVVGACLGAATGYIFIFYINDTYLEDKNPLQLDNEL